MWVAIANMVLAHRGHDLRLGRGRSASASVGLDGCQALRSRVVMRTPSFFSHGRRLPSGERRRQHPPQRRSSAGLVCSGSEEQAATSKAIAFSEATASRRLSVENRCRHYTATLVQKYLRQPPPIARSCDRRRQRACRPETAACNRMPWLLQIGIGGVRRVPRFDDVAAVISVLPSAKR